MRLYFHEFCEWIGKCKIKTCDNKRFWLKLQITDVDTLKLNSCPFTRNCNIVKIYSCKNVYLYSIAIDLNKLSTQGEYSWWRQLKGIVSDSNNIFLWHESKDIKGVLHPRPVFGLFLHFSQKLQHIGNK